MCTSRARQAGLTMIELIMFIVIIGVAVAGVLTVFAYTSNNSADPLQRKQAMLLAEAAMEEVSLARFTFCHPDDAKAETATSAADCATLAENVGPRSGELRPFYNVNDYVGAFNSATALTPGDPQAGYTDVTGSGVSGAVGYYKTFLTIRPATLGPAGMQIGPVPGGVNAADTNVLHISVRVVYGNNQSIVLDGYRTRYAPNSMP
jgi:MSHA pilin protein MshD